MVDFKKMSLRSDIDKALREFNERPEIKNDKLALSEYSRLADNMAKAWIAYDEYVISKAKIQ